MKKIVSIIAFAGSMVSALHAQVLNGSFENGTGGDLSNWQWTCGAQSDNSSPTGPGWCIKVSAGNTQSCFPGYAYQEIPSIVNGQSCILSGWAYKQASPYVGIYFGKIHNGTITLQAGDTTSSTSWTPLSIQSVFNLGAGDTAVVVLFGGLTGGPVQGYGFFDLINLQVITGMNDHAGSNSVSVFPNPANENIRITTSGVFALNIFDLEGRSVYISEENYGMANVDCSSFANGIYIFKIETAEGCERQLIEIVH